MLQKLCKRIVFLTNNATRPDDKYVLRFKDSGIKTTMVSSIRFILFNEYEFIRVNAQDEFLHPGYAIVAHLQRIHFTGLIYFLGSTNLKNMIVRAGFKVIEGVCNVASQIEIAEYF